MHSLKKEILERKGVRVILKPIPTNTATNNVKIDVTKPVKYLLKDETIPELIKNMPAPPASNSPPYYIEGYVGGGFELNTLQNQSANVAVTVANTLNHINKYADMPIGRWSSGKNLIIRPRAGKMFNAYYNRKTLSFFYDKDPVTKKDVFTCDSTDIVAHELGHAILDTYRPDLWNVAALEIWAFHEAFGDIIAFLSSLTHDEIITKILKETNGDFSKTNIASQLAEGFGRTIFNVEGEESGRVPNWLRNLNNSYSYVEISTLNKDCPENLICAEPHNFSRIMSGAIYDIFNIIYQDNILKGKNQFDSIKEARNILTFYITKALRNVPVQALFFEAFAKTILWVDWNLPEKPYHNKMWDIFVKRNIIKPLMALWYKPNPPKIKDVKTIKMVDHIEIMSLNSNPLYFVDVEVADSSHESIEAANHAIHYLNETNNVSNTFGTPFTVSNGKLTRTHFACCGASSPLNQPSKFQPEYLKPYKPQNNTGCGCGAKKKDPEIVARPKIKRGCYVRYKM